jgi:hypothetical protein
VFNVRFTNEEFDKLFGDPKKLKQEHLFINYRDYVMSYLLLFKEINLYKLCSLTEGDINIKNKLIDGCKIDSMVFLYLREYLLIKSKKIYQYNGTTKYFYNPKLFTSKANKGFCPESIRSILCRYMYRLNISENQINRYYDTQLYIKQNGIENIIEYKNKYKKN